MSKSLEDLIDEDYERLDQEVYEMEELGLSNYGDRSYYIRNRDEYEKDKTIADLEAKLAESDEIINNLEQQCLICNKDKENEQLKQQLAEKDAEIEKLKSMAERSSSVLDRFNYCGESIVYNTTREQDKISFCIEQLEKVKEYCREEAYHDSYGDYMIVYERRYYEDDEEKTPNDDLMGFLDNLLKEME